MADSFPEKKSETRRLMHDGIWRLVYPREKTRAIELDIKNRIGRVVAGLQSRSAEIRAMRSRPRRTERKIFKAGCCTYAWHSLCYARITSAIPVGGWNCSRPGETASNTFRSVARGVSKGIRRGYRSVERLACRDELVISDRLDKCSRA